MTVPDEDDRYEPGRYEPGWYEDDPAEDEPAEDEMYDRFGHDARYLRDDVPPTDPSLDWRTREAGRIAWGINHNSQAPRLLRQFLVGLVLLVAFVFVVFAIYARSR